MKLKLPIGGALLIAASTSPVSAADLPIPCVAGSCGPNVKGFVTSGQVNATTVGNTLTVKQQTDRAILNWSSFNIGADGKVIFQQPDVNSIALNRIFQDSPSKIFGTLTANGQIYLVNPNGILFGATSSVKTAGLLASTLNISDSTFKNGLLSPVATGLPALDGSGHPNVLDADGNPVLGPDGKPLKVEISVEKGAQITTANSGQRVMLAAQNIKNAGTISAPDGQVILAAGEKVYLAASTDPALRGLLVEVDTGGTAWNQLTGNISADRGNVTVVGLAVNQDGRMSATTTVSANGSIRLLARDTVEKSRTDGVLNPMNGGKLQLGAQSMTSVLPELGSTETAVDDQPQLASRVDLNGRQVVIKGGAQVVVPGGIIAANANKNPATEANAGTDADSRIRVESGAILDVSGSDAVLPVSSALVTVELRANELKDSPLQRDGALRGKTVIVDRRVGTPLADVSGAIAAIPKTIAERTSEGGSIKLDSEGDVVVATGARMDVSGGKITYQAGTIQTTKLIGADGKLVDIGQADPNKIYVGLINPTSRKTYDRWGITETIAGPSIGKLDPGYVEGQDAGTLQIAAYNMVLNGDFFGAVTVGEFQREKMPAGGQFIIGDPLRTLGIQPDFRAPSVVFTDKRPQIAVSSDAQLAGPRALELPTDFLSQGFTSTAIYSNGDITVPDSLPLDLVPGSSLTLQGHGVQVNSNITAPGGKIQLTSTFTPPNSQIDALRPYVHVAKDVTFDVSGLWTNDLTALNAGRLASDPLAPNAGSIGIVVTTADFAEAVPGELNIGDGVQFLANGGAWVKSQTTTVGGTGGSISIKAGDFESPWKLGEGVGLQAFGVNGARGGSFTLEAARIDMGHDGVWAHAQAIDQPEPATPQTPEVPETPGTTTPATPVPPPKPKPPAKLVLGDGLFSNSGFSTFSLTATGVGVADDAPDAPVVSFDVLSGAQIDARTRTFLLSADSRNVASGAGMASLGAVTLLPDTERGSSSITMKVAPRKEVGTNSGWLRVEAGSTLLADPQSSFSFSALRGVLLAGDITAHSGTVSASVTRPSLGDNDAGFLSDQRIEIAPSARIDLSGIALFEPNDRGLQQGNVLGGGRLSLTAQRGSVLINRGAFVDVSGTQAAIDLADASAGSGYQRQFVASAAGSVDLLARESVQWLGSLSAHAGRGNTGTASGGSLSIGITRDDPGFGLPDDPVLGTKFPNGPRIMSVVSGSNLASDQNGVAVVDTSKVVSSGFDSLSLRAGDRIEFAGDVSLSLGRQLSLDAPLISAGTANKVDLSAPYISWGFSRIIDKNAPATQGGAQLTVRADTLELFGATSLAGFASSRFEAQHDIRLRDADTANGQFGLLRASGNLTLAASRIFPLSGQNFEIRAQGTEDDDTTGTVRIEQIGVSSGTPLSADGALSIFARNIVQGGTLLAPFGTIQLNATKTLDLLDGSLTSVSADRTIPFGFVEAGTDWKHNQTVTAVPDRVITLTAPTLRTGEGSTVDLRGGGDLYAYTWVPGTGGTKDRLAAGATPGLYAIIPAEKVPYAVIDPAELQNSGLRAGDSVYLAGTADVPAGVYALLPARYALLPGAYLVNATSGGSDIRPGVTSTLPDGGITVAGYRTFGSTGIGDTRYTTWVVHPGSYGRQISGYEDHLASKFFPDQAASHDQPPPVIPADAGRLVLNPSKLLDVRGDVLTAGASGGVGASIDIAASNLAVTAERIVYATPQIDAATLQKWNPHRLVLGGRTSTSATSSGSADERQIDVSADNVIIGRNVNLSLDEIVIVANDEISIESGAHVASRTTSNAVDTPDVELTLTGANAAGASIVAVSDLAHYEVKKPDGAPTSLARVDLASDAQLASRGALLLDAPGGAQLDGTLSGNGAAWSLSSGRIVFGESDATDGIVIDSRLSALLNQGRSVEIGSTGAMDFTESLTVGSSTQDLTLRAATLRTLQPQTSVVFAANTLTLEGATAASVKTLSTGDSTLTARARDIVLGPGFLDFDGFGPASLVASRDVRGEGASLFRMPGSLDVTAQRFTMNAGADTSLEVGDAFRILRGSGVSNGDTAGLGGSLRVHAGSIEHSGLIEMPTGRVELIADHGLTLADGSVIDVSGRTVTAAGRSASSWGGAIRLGAGDDGLIGASGSKLLLQGAGEADGGNLTLTSGGALAFDSSLNAHGMRTGGSVTIDAGSITDFGALNARLESAGFNEARRITVATGDLNLAAGTTTTARTVELTTNDGSINVAGSIVALSDSQRASISLFGAHGVTLESGGLLQAEGLGADGRGGYVTLGTFDGAINLASNSEISTRGTEADGRLWLRAPALGNDVNITGIGSKLTGVDSVVVESVLRFDDLGPVLSNLEFGTYQTAANTYAGAAIGNIYQRLGAGLGGVTLHAQVGLDLYRASDLWLGSGDPFLPGSLDLSTWRFAGEPGALTIRSGGTITVNGTVSDGFSTNFSGVTSLLDQRSATIRLAAGAAFQSANPLGVTAGAAGDLVFSPFSVLRTGTGDIGLAAAGNVLIGDNDFGAASIYTAGVPGFKGPIPGVTPLRNTVFPTDGGSIFIAAGGNIVGARVVGGVGEWQPRAGRGGTAVQAIPTQWGTDLSLFSWNVGSLGGGDLTVRADGNVVDLSAAAADSAIELTPDVLTQFRGGVLSVDAGGDVSSAMLHMTRGDNHVRTEGSLGGGSRLDDFGDVLGSFFSIADGTLTVRARDNAVVEGALEPSVLIQPSQTRQSYFLTAGGNSALDIQSAAGNVELHSDRLTSFIGLEVASNTNESTLGLVPASLKMAALSGDIEIGGSITLTPSDNGQLDLFAFKDLCMLSNSCAILMSDVAASAIPSPLSPVSIEDFGTLLPGGTSARHINDRLPAMITVGQDLGQSGFLLAKSANISVGHDIIGLNLSAQNLRPEDVTQVIAGRDITWTGADGARLAGEIQVGGPGRLDMLAGRNIDLGFSVGVSTTGNLRNPNLPTSEGADLTMLAGLGKALDYTDFFDDIVAKSADGRKALIDYIAKVTGVQPLTFDAAAQAFAALDEITQRPFLLDVFFKELVASGREANADPNVGFERGYAAIDALLPGARSTDPKNPNPYEGDLLMSFSRIYTLAGGSITLMVPGGLLNVGLANPPPSLGTKKPSDLGIVAQRAGDVRIYTSGDVLVNQSRIFTLGGGDIAIWSNLGDIDAGRGSKTSVSAPPPAVLVDSSGKVTLDFAGAVAGSGIRTITATADRTVKPGDVDLMAPAGTVNAGDAGIGAAGNINIAAQHVVGLDNIQFGGTSTGVPSEVSSLGASLSGVSAVASSASNASGSSVTEQAPSTAAAPLADSALGWLDVFVTGFGEESCSANDAECLKRQQAK